MPFANALLKTHHTLRGPDAPPPEHLSQLWYGEPHLRQNLANGGFGADRIECFDHRLPETGAGLLDQRRGRERDENAGLRCYCYQIGPRSRGPCWTYPGDGQGLNRCRLLCTRTCLFCCIKAWLKAACKFTGAVSISLGLTVFITLFSFKW